MAVDLSTRTCDSCAHASVCPNREVFLKFYENRNALLCKTGGDSNGETGTIDTSETVSVRVEHRYLDGPGLEKTYRELGLHGGGWSPCLSATYSGCPFHCTLNSPFDAPVYSPYPHAAGYIEPLCNSARDLNGNRIPFHVGPQPGNINTYPTFPQRSWWNCEDCHMHNDCLKSNDFAKLGGTVYSTFGIGEVTAKVGSDVIIADIETPKSIMANYRRADDTPETFTVKSEEDVIIIYYQYGVPDEEPDLTRFMTIAEMEEAGVMHNVEFFFNDKGYFYPSLEPSVNPDKLMDVYLDGVICGPICRRSEDGSVLCGTGDFIQLSRVNDQIAMLYTNSGEAIDTNLSELIGSYAGKMLTIDEAALEAQKYSGKPTTVSIDQGNYRKFHIAEGDRLMIRFRLDPKYRLDLSLMRIMNFGVDVEMASSRSVGTTSTGKKFMEEILVVTAPKGDFVIQTCLTDAQMYEDQLNYVPVNYENTWDSYQIGWNYKKTIVRNEKTPIDVYQPIAPRKWPSAMVTDLTPEYDTDCPPSAKYLVRPFFELVGYTRDSIGRSSFNPNLEVLTPFEATYPKEVRFLDTRLFDDNTYWAMWTVNYMQLYATVTAALRDVSIDNNITTIAEPRIKTFSDLINRSKYATEGQLMDKMWKWTSECIKVPYHPNIRQYILDSILASNDYPVNFTTDVIVIPNGISEVRAYNNFDTELAAWKPTVIGTTPSGQNVILNDGSYPQDDNSSLIQSYVVLVYPSHSYGLIASNDQFIAIQLDVEQQLQEVTATFIFDSKYMKTDYKKIFPYLDKAKAYHLKGVYPDDAADVGLELDGNEIKLVGSRAQFYKPNTECELSYEQSVGIATTYDNARVDTYIESSVAAFGGGVYDFEIPQGHSLKELKINDNTLYNAGTLYEDRYLGTGFDAQFIMSATRTSFRVTVSNVTVDLNIKITMHVGDDGTVEGCSRCREYVDVKPYDFIDWYPTCANYQGT